MAKGKIRATCSGLREDGKGIVRIGGRETAVSGLLPGETASFEEERSGSRVITRLVRIEEASKDRVQAPCPVFDRCGGCQLQHLSYEGQLGFKQKAVESLFAGFGRVNPILGMAEPWSYRNKVHSTLSLDKAGRIISGIYEENSHKVIPTPRCLIQDAKADEIIATLLELLKAFKLKPYEEDRGRGFLRHILVKRGFCSGEVMVVLVTADRLFPGRAEFVKALLGRHPEITTMIQNINSRRTSMVLGDEEKVLYGKGYIEDSLCGCVFQISARSFYQINPRQTEVLYEKAIEMARLQGRELVLDAYCGIGTISLIAASRAGQVVGVELNRDAVKDALRNAKVNGISNVRFQAGDAGDFMKKLASAGEEIEVVFLDPPRGGSDEQFLSSLVRLMPERVVYISCNPETQLRDVLFLTKNGYKVLEIQPVDMFPQTFHSENIVSLKRVRMQKPSASKGGESREGWNEGRSGRSGRNAGGKGKGKGKAW